MGTNDKVSFFIQKALVTIPKPYINYISDLKGSTAKRLTFPKGYQPTDIEIKGVTLKDLDFLYRFFF